MPENEIEFTINTSHLDADGVLNLDEILNTNQLYSKIIFGNISSSCFITQITANQSFKVKKLFLGRCQGITSLPDCFKELENLEIINCQSLESLPDNLTNVKELLLSDCKGLKSLPDNLKVTTHLKILDCNNLTATTTLDNKLLALLNSSCNVVVEDRLHPIKRRLSNCINYKNMRNTKVLFSRFLDENINKRGGFDAIQKSSESLLVMLKDYPEHHAWVEERAGYYLEGCVNQPVFGFLEISAFAAIVTKDNIIDRLEAAKELMAKTIITRYVIQKNFPFKGHEAEAGNKLLSVVHNELLKKGAKNRGLANPWLAVPTQIYHDIFSVKSFVKKHKDEAVKIIQDQVLSATPEKVSEWLSTYHAEIWAQIAFPKEFAKIEQEFASYKIALDILVNSESSKEIIKQLNNQETVKAHEKDAVNDAIVKYIGIMRQVKKGEPVDCLKYKNTPDAQKKLGEFYENLQNKKIDKIRQKVSELVMAEIEQSNSFIVEAAKPSSSHGIQREISRGFSGSHADAIRQSNPECCVLS